MNRTEQHNVEEGLRDVVVDVYDVSRDELSSDTNPEKELDGNDKDALKMAIKVVEEFHLPVRDEFFRGKTVGEMAHAVKKIKEYPALQSSNQSSEFSDEMRSTLHEKFLSFLRNQTSSNQANFEKTFREAESTDPQRTRTSIQASY